MDDSLRQTFTHKLNPQTPDVLVDAVVDMLRQGVPRDEILVALDDVRGGLDEPSEEIVLDVMDRLEGYCPPSRRL